MYSQARVFAPTRDVGAVAPSHLGESRAVGEDLDAPRSWQREAVSTWVSAAGFGVYTASALHYANPIGSLLASCYLMAPAAEREDLRVALERLVPSGHLPPLARDGSSGFDQDAYRLTIDELDRALALPWRSDDIRMVDAYGVGDAHPTPLRAFVHATRDLTFRLLVARDNVVGQVVRGDAAAYDLPLYEFTEEATRTVLGAPRFDPV